MDHSLENALKKAKRKQFIKTVIISLAVVLISLPILYKTGNYFAARGSTSLHKQLLLHNAIAEPNIRIDSQVTSNRSMFGGNIVTNRSKNINGYLVQWSTLTSSYGWLRNDVDYNELIPGFFRSEKEFYEYDKQTKSKVATFYHPAIQQYYVIENKLKEISQVKNQVAEVAISFNQPYTLREIQEKIPDNLNIVWLYMTSHITDESKGPAGMPVYGFNPSKSSEDAYEDFIASLEAYDPKGYNEAIQELLKENKNKKFSEVEILGVMLTGRTQNFNALVNEEFVRGASVGATAEIVPYIQPEK